MKKKQNDSHLNDQPPAVLSARGRTGAKASPWSRGPMLKNSQRAKDEFAKRERRP